MAAAEVIQGASALPRALGLVRRSRPLLVLSLVAAVLNVASLLLLLCFFLYAFETGRRSGLYVALSAVSLLVGLILLPIWGPVAYAVQARAAELARAALAGHPPPSVTGGWWLGRTCDGLIALPTRSSSFSACEGRTVGASRVLRSGLDSRRRG